MPNRKTHINWALATAGIAGLVRAQELPEERRLPMLLGCVWGGYLGGVAPDVAEPSFRNPRHRGICHSEPVTVMLAEIARKKVAGWERWCHTQADLHRREAEALPLGSLARFLKELGACFLEFLAGVLLGFVVGYASHIVLDMQTPASVGFLAMCH